MLVTGGQKAENTIQASVLTKAADEKQLPEMIAKKSTLTRLTTDCNMNL